MHFIREITGSCFRFQIVLYHVSVTCHDEQGIDRPFDDLATGFPLRVHPGSRWSKARADLQR